MSFSGILTVQASGRMIVPRRSTGPLLITFAEAYVRTYASRASNATYVTIPAALRALWVLPAKLQVKIENAEEAPDEPTLEPIDGSFEFIATARLHKKSAHVTIPMAWVRSIGAWSTVRVQIGDDYDAIIAPRSNVQGVLGLVVPRTLAGTSVRVRVSRAVTVDTVETVSDGIDWMAVRTEQTRAIQNDRIVVPTQRSQLTIHRTAPLASTMWLLGLYQADGDKTALWFCVTNKSRVVLGQARDALLALGLSNDDLALTLLFGSASRDWTEAYYHPLGITQGGFRTDKGKNIREHGANLHVKSSLGLAKLLRSKVDEIMAKPEELSIEARKQFLLGWLAGDGTLTNAKPARLVASCGSASEASAIARIIADYIGRESEQEVQITGECHAIHRTIDGFTLARLIDDGAFTGNLARARMFFIARRLLWPEQIHGVHKRWGYFDANNQPTEALITARALFEKNAEEWRYVQARYGHEENSSTGVKGALYEFDRAYITKRTRDERRADAVADHAKTKREQIRRVLAGQHDLVIYEAHAGGGACTKAHREFGVVEAHVHSDGDDRVVIAGADPQGYDVVDLDPYGYPFNLLLNALGIIKSNGWLFVTCPDPAKNFRGATKRIQEALFPEVPAPFEAGSVADLIRRYGILRGLRIELIERLDLGSVWRFAFKTSKL